MFKLLKTFTQTSFRSTLYKGATYSLLNNLILFCSVAIIFNSIFHKTLVVSMNIGSPNYINTQIDSLLSNSYRRGPGSSTSFTEKRKVRNGPGVVTDRSEVASPSNLLSWSSILRPC